MTRLFSSPLARIAAASCLALALSGTFGLTPADARLGGGSSFGSRGGRTFSMPPATATAPRPASPFQSTETPRYGSGYPGGYGAPFGQPRRFGFGSGLAAGLLGAGVLGLLTGHGFFGGLGGVTSLLGLLLQIGLIVMLVRFALGFFRNRGAAFAGAGPMGRAPLGGLGMGGASRGPAGTAIPITPADFTAFERALSETQYAYSREDLNALGRLATPEMTRNLAGELEATRRRNLRNDLADVRLLQGDLSEAWREGGTDYATVAMRFSCRDTMVDRATGRVVEGDPNRVVEATELWTFRRDDGRPWVLSAVQQTG